MRRTQEERRAETRAKLLDATIVSLREAGYQATTTRRVCELAGVSQGAMTHHFPHRADLVAAAAERLAEQRIGELERRAARLPQDPEELAPALLELLWKDFSGDLFSVFVKLWVAAAHDPELHASMAGVERMLARVIASRAPVISRALGEAEDFDARLQLVLATLRGLALSRAFEPGAPRGTGTWRAVRPLLEEILLSPRRAAV